MSKYNNTTFKFVPNDNILDYSPIHECDLSLSEESSSTWIFPIIFRAGLSMQYALARVWGREGGQGATGGSTIRVGQISKI